MNGTESFVAFSFSLLSIQFLLLDRSGYEFHPDLKPEILLFNPLRTFQIADEFLIRNTMQLIY